MYSDVVVCVLIIAFRTLSLFDQDSLWNHARLSSRRFLRRNFLATRVANPPVEAELAIKSVVTVVIHAGHMGFPLPFEAGYCSASMVRRTGQDAQDNLGDLFGDKGLAQFVGVPGANLKPDF
jgi:hypothetical protein